MAIACSVRMRGGGIDSFLGFEYCVVITLASREFRVLLTILPTNLRFLRIFASSGSHGVAFVRATVAFATVAATITAPILLLPMRSAAVVAFFSPVS